METLGSTPSDATLAPSGRIRLPVSSRRIWIRILAAATILLSGAAMGAVGTVLFIRMVVLEVFTQPDAFADRILARMEGELDLSDQQRAEIEAILDVRYGEVHEARIEAYQRLFHELDHMRVAIGQVLDDDQRAVWNERFETVVRRLMPSSIIEAGISAEAPSLRLPNTDAGEVVE